MDLLWFIFFSMHACNLSFIHAVFIKAYWLVIDVFIVVIYLVGSDKDFVFCKKYNTTHIPQITIIYM